MEKVKEIYRKISGLFLETTVIRKIQLAFILLLLIISIGGVMIFVNTNYINSEAQDLNQNIIPTVKTNQSIIRIMNERLNRVYRWQIGYDSLNISNPQRLEMKFEEVEKHMDDEEGLQLIEEFRQADQELLEFIKEIKESEAGSAKRKILINKVSDINNTIVLANAKVNKYIIDKLTTKAEYINELSSEVGTRTIAINLFGLIIGILLGVIITKSVGKLTETVKRKTNDTASKIKETTKSAQEMRKLADDTKDKITKAFSFIKELADGNSEVAKAVEEVTISIQEVANGVEDLSIQADNIFTAGNDTYQAVKETSTKIKRGNKIANNTADIMKELQDSVSKINEISGKIMNIADQTNLLALNAAIEAARAGEYGRGFTVVAEEIKDLADESMRATKEVQSITQEVEGVAKKAVVAIMDEDNTNEDSIISIFGEINQLSEQVTDKMESVVDSASNQVASSEEMNASAEEIAASSQEASGQTEEAANLTEELNKMIEEVTEYNDGLYRRINEQVNNSEEQLNLINETVRINQRLKKTNNKKRGYLSQLKRKLLKIVNKRSK